MKKLFLLGVLLFAGAKIGFAATELAKVNNRVITLEEFNKRYENLTRAFPSKALSKPQVLDDYIKQILGTEDAKRLKIDQDPEFIEEQNAALFQVYVNKVLAKDFGNLSVSTKEIKTYYEANPEVRTSQIFIAAPRTGPKEEETDAYNRINDILKKQLGEGKSFAEVAQNFSEGPTAPMGGDLGYLGKDRFAEEPEYYEAAKKLKAPGKVSGVVRTVRGFHIIKLTAIKPYYEVNTALIREQIMTEKRQALYDKKMAELRSRYKVEIKTSLLK